MSKPQKAVVAGASGYIGQHVSKALRTEGFQVVTVGRGPENHATWADPDSLVRALDGSELLINFAGRSVSCRYNKQNVDEMFRSRIETTAALGQAMSRAHHPPQLWINASTGTIYRDARDRPMDEATGDIGSGLSVELARAWEHELFSAPTSVRKVALRMAIVIGSGGGAINPLINLAKIGFGGRQGDGDQVFSWVHVDDVAGAILHILRHPEIAGPVNVASPTPSTNAEFMRSLRTAFGRKLGVPLPSWSLEFGARMIRTEAELVLKSRWVEPRILIESGYQFAFDELSDALAEIASKTPRGFLTVPLG